ncbi:hypothetical protein FEL34_06560 [Escherichia coli]|nr:hypothetical protein [Escherichia coli]
MQRIKILVISLQLPLRAETEVLCFIETFQRDLVFNRKPGWRFFLIEAESFQFSKRGELCSSYPYRTSIRAKRPETKKRRFARSLRRWCGPVM